MTESRVGTRPRQVLEAARAQILREVAQAPAEWQPALFELATDFFASDLSLSSLRQRHSLSKPAHSASFRKAFGRSFAAYVRKWRAEVGDQLLKTTGLTISEVAALTGFGVTASFREACKRDLGRAPSELRQPQAAAGRPRAKKDRAKQHDQRARRFLFLGLGADEAVEMRRSLKAIAAQRKPRPAELAEALEQRVAVSWWCRLRDLPPTEQRRELATGYRFQTPALFRHLMKMSREEGRLDRRRGLEIARLAMAALEPLASVLPGSKLSNLQVQAWLALGNAQRLVFELEKAEDAFAEAGLLLAGPAAPRELLAELAWLRCELRRYQRRLPEALAFAAEAVELAETDELALAIALLVRGTACWCLGEDELAVSDFRDAKAKLGPDGDPYLRLVALQNLAAVHLQCGRIAEAHVHFELAKNLAVEIGRPEPRLHTRWLEGLLAAKAGREAHAEDCLREALKGFQALEDRGHCALLALDLAALALHRNRPEEAVTALSEALPLIEALRFEGEALGALKLLQRAVAERELSLGLVEQIQAHARRLPGP